MTNSATDAATTDAAVVEDAGPGEDAPPPSCAWPPGLTALPDNVSFVYHGAPDPCVAARFLDDIVGPVSGLTLGMPRLTSDIAAHCATAYTETISGGYMSCTPLCAPTEYGAFCGATAPLPTGCHAVGAFVEMYCCPCGDTLDSAAPPDDGSLGD